MLGRHVEKSIPSLRLSLRFVSISENGRRCLSVGIIIEILIAVDCLCFALGACLDDMCGQCLTKLALPSGPS